MHRMGCAFRLQQHRCQEPLAWQNTITSWVMLNRIPRTCRTPAKACTGHIDDIELWLTPKLARLVTPREGVADGGH